MFCRLDFHKVGTNGQPETRREYRGQRCSPGRTVQGHVRQDDLQLIEEEVDPYLEPGEGSRGVSTAGWSFAGNVARVLREDGTRAELLMAAASALAAGDDTGLDSYPEWQALPGL